MPARLALALQADGWWVRSDIIWHKPNPMPESCTDRPTCAHEHVFLLTKSARYFYDADAVREDKAFTGACEPRDCAFRQVNASRTRGQARRWQAARESVQTTAAQPAQCLDDRHGALQRGAFRDVSRQRWPSAASRLARRSAAVAASAASRGCG